MQYGVCGGNDIAAIARQAGFTYMETTVGALLKPCEGEDAFASALTLANAAGLAVETASCFIPGDLKITGLAVDLSALETYVTTACRRARKAGVSVIVFGSGGARQIPSGFDRAQAQSQLVMFCRMVAPIARQHSVTVVVEPLNVTECNVLNTVGECAALVRAVNHPSLRLLVDAYHLMKDHDSYEDIVAHGDLLAHVHIGTVPQRMVPGAEECDFQPFFDALVQAGYTGRVSIEAQIPDPPVTLPHALALMTGWEQAARKRLQQKGTN